MAERLTEHLRQKVAGIWEAQHQHPFVRGIGDGTLGLERFEFWLRQDYVFLIEYARLLALAAARSPNLETMIRFARLVKETLETEMSLHRAYAAEFGIGCEELEQESSAPTTRAYTDFLLRVAALGDYAELVAALLPCMWCFSEIGQRLATQPAPSEKRYAKWVAMYSSSEFAELAQWCRDLLDNLAAGLPERDVQKLEAAFSTSSRYEWQFWEMAWKRSAGGYDRCASVRQFSRRESTGPVNIPRVLIIAGSDSGGGAGIQADLKTVSALGAFGMTAITALTAQNTTGVYAIVEIEAKFVARQIEACASDIGCDAVKTGMLANAEIIDAVAAAISNRRLGPLVMDPVMIAKSGARLLKPDAIEALKTKLLPLATVVTPNLHEAGALTGREITTLEQMKEAARAIREMGPENVVVKGGHLESIAADVLYDGRDFTEFRAERINTKNTHGSGCIFASALAASLAHKKTVRESVTAAKDFITAAIRGSLTIGKGYGPANPMASLYHKAGL